ARRAARRRPGRAVPRGYAGAGGEMGRVGTAPGNRRRDRRRRRRSRAADPADGPADRITILRRREADGFVPRADGPAEAQGSADGPGVGTVAGAGATGAGRSPPAAFRLALTHDDAPHATFANYTSYRRSINGLMVDVAGRPG